MNRQRNTRIFLKKQVNFILKFRFTYTCTLYNARIVLLIPVKQIYHVFY